LFNWLKHFRKAKYLYLALGLVAAAGVGFALGNIRDTGSEASRQTPGTQAGIGATDGSAVNRNEGESLSEAEDKLVISQDTVIYYEYDYELCGHIYEEEKAPTQEMIGLDAEGLAKMFPEALSTSIDGDGAHVKLSFDQICPQHVMLKLEGDKCVIYRNVLGTEEMKKQQEFSIDKSKWDSSWLQSLKEGIVFDSVEDLESFVEDMES